MPYSSFIKRDYKSMLDEGYPRSWRILPVPWLIIGISLVAGILLYSHNPDNAEAMRVTSDDVTTPVSTSRELIHKPLDLPERPENPTSATEQPAQSAHTAESEQSVHTAETEVALIEEGSWHEVTVQPGDSLAKIFNRQGLSPRDLHDIISLGKDTHALKRIHPGQILRARTSQEGNTLYELVYQQDRTHKLVVKHKADGFSAQFIKYEPERRLTHVSGTITSSLFLAAQEAKLSDSLTMELAGIFGWDIDFALDIREGDNFTVIYEELYLGSEKIKDGNIVAAEFVNRDRSYQAVRYTDPKGRTDYYNPDGASMRKAFLRTPVPLARVSSRFNLKRKHPVLNRVRAHKGVDYAVSPGTPVKAAGDGKIITRGRKGGYGKTIVLQHGSRYSTLYAHLSGYSRKFKHGSRVRQGDIIGYSGNTGLTSGPHLHYEFRVNGVHRNPLTVKLPDAAPINAHYKKDFQTQSQPLLTQLNLVRSRQLAMSEKN